MPTKRTTVILAVLFVAVIAVSYFACMPTAAPLAVQVSLASDYIKPNPANTLPASATKVALAEPSAATSAPQPAEEVGYPWHKYPGTLNDQVLQAFASKDGQMAFDVADLLGTCVLFEMVKQKNKSLHKVQTEYANCQTLQGELRETMLDLLVLAREKNIKGAAINSFSYERKNPEIVQAIVDDAYAGHAKTIAFMSDTKPAEFGLTALQQTVLIYALKLAAADTEVGESLEFDLNWAEDAAYQSGLIKTRQFDPRSLSEAAKAEARIIAERIITLTKKKQIYVAHPV